MSLMSQIEEDFQNAFKNKNEAVVAILRLLKSALINKKIEKLTPKEDDLADSDTIAVIQSEIKKRQDSIELYNQGNRSDLANQEQSEISILEKYLPEQLSENDLREIIKQTISELGAATSADFGRVMGEVMKQVKGQADGQVITKIVKEELNK